MATYSMSDDDGIGANILLTFLQREISSQATKIAHWASMLGLIIFFKQKKSHFMALFTVCIQYIKKAMREGGAYGQFFLVVKVCCFLVFKLHLKPGMNILGHWYEIHDMKNT